MAGPLVETKLLLPRPRARAVARPRLDELLQRGSQARLTLVSAPAGFGKTTLLAGWLAGEGRSVRRRGCLSTSGTGTPRRSGPTSCWPSTAPAPGTATAALALLQSGQADVESMLAALLNELSVLPDDLTLVLDDYHLAEGPDIQPGMAFLLDHLPPQVHLVISTRADPALPLSRLRARGELVEVRAADLRFTADEATAYLNDVNALDLEPADVAALETRTEGWAAALQLAALSLQGRDDRRGSSPGSPATTGSSWTTSPTRSSTGSRDDLRRFLLDTSVLDRLTAPLCDAVTGRDRRRGDAGVAGAAEPVRRPARRPPPLVPVPPPVRRRAACAPARRGARRRRPRCIAAPATGSTGAGDPEAAVRHALAAGDVGSGGRPGRARHPGAAP